MRVQETRFYNFKGSFSYAYRRFPDQSEVVFSDFKVWDNDKALPKAEEERKGHFVLINQSAYTELGWAFQAKDELRKFTISYEVEGALKKYEDAVVLYYKFIDRDWSVPQSKVRIEVEHETGENREIQHWLHGYANASSEQAQNGAIVVLAPDVPKSTFLELRILYPIEWFSTMPVYKATYVKEAIRQEEKAWAEKANAQRLAAEEKAEKMKAIEEKGPYVVLLSFLVFIIVIYKVYQSGRTDNSLPEKAGDYHRKPPSSLHPSMLNYLFYGSLRGNELLIALYNLAHKKILKIEDRNEGKKNSSKHMYWKINREELLKKADDLLDFEQDLIAFVFGKISKGRDELSFHDMSKNRYAWSKFVISFNKQLTAYAKSLKIWSAKSTKAMYKLFMLAFLLFTIGFPAAYFFKLWGAFLFLLSVLAFILAFAVRQRTLPYQQAYLQWVSYRDHLRNALRRNSEQSISAEEISDHLLYGIALRLNRVQIKRMIQQVPHHSLQSYLYWYVILHPGRGNATNISNTISQMATNLVGSPMSGASGAGGGASFGGGGGVSAGGGGAR